MRLRQMKTDFAQEHDRLLLRISTFDEAEVRFWLTRRFVKLLWTAMLKMAESTGAARAQPDPETRKALMQFERDKALAGADFATPYQDSPKAFPLGQEPLLLTQIRIGQDPQGNGILGLHPAQGQGIDLTLDSALMHSFMQLIQSAVEKADWDLNLALPKSAVQPGGTPDPRRLN